MKQLKLTVHDDKISNEKLYLLQLNQLTYACDNLVTK